MYSTIEHYFVEGPLTEFEAFKKAYEQKKFGLSNDIRLAVNCAVAFYHTHEHVYHHVQKVKEAYSKPKKYLEDYLLVKFPEFNIIRDITDCSKHHTLDRQNVLISNASQLNEYMISTAHKDEKGIYFSSKKGIYATLNDGTEINIYKLLTVTRYFWLYEFYELGIRENIPEKPDFTPVKPQRESESGAAKLDLVAMEGHPMNMKFKLYAESPELAKELSQKSETK